MIDLELSMKKPILLWCPQRLRCPPQPTSLSKEGGRSHLATIAKSLEKQGLDTSECKEACHPVNGYIGAIRLKILHLEELGLKVTIINRHLKCRCNCDDKEDNC